MNNKSLFLKYLLFTQFSLLRACACMIEHARACALYPVCEQLEGDNGVDALDIASAVNRSLAGSDF